MNGDSIWVKSKWTKQELDGQSVQFSIPQGHQRLEGTGKFLVKDNPEGLLSLELCTFAPQSPAETIEHRLRLPQAAVDRIERHPNQSIAHFRLA